MKMLCSELLKAYLSMKKSLRVNKAFTELVLSEGSVSEITRALADFSQARVEVLNSSGEILARARPPVAGECPCGDDSSVIDKVVMVNEDLTVVVKMTKTGQPISDEDILAIESAAHNIGIVLLKEQHMEEVEKQYQHVFLNDLVDGVIASREEMIQRGSYHGLDLAGAYLLILLNISSLDQIFPARSKKETYRLLRKTIGLVFKSFFSVAGGSIVWNRNNNIIILYTLPDEYVVEAEHKRSEIKQYSYDIAANIKQAVEQNIEHITITIGLGTFYSDIAELSKSYREAVDAVRTGKSAWGDNNIYHYDDLGVYKLLVKYHDKAELRLYADEMLGPLVEYDMSNNTRFLDTLEQLLNYQGNQKQAAGKLFIHPKTLSYRKKKIQEILDVSLDNAEDTFNLYMAIKIIKVLGSR